MKLTWIASQLGQVHSLAPTALPLLYSSTGPADWSALRTQASMVIAPATFRVGVADAEA